MATKDKLVKSGIHTNTADAVVGDMKTGVTAAGATQATATALTADHTKVGTTAASTGVILRKIAGAQVVYNGGANAMSVYPPVGGTINSGAANAAFSVATTKTAMFMSSDGVSFVAVLSA